MDFLVRTQVRPVQKPQSQVIVHLDPALQMGPGLNPYVSNGERSS